MGKGPKMQRRETNRADVDSADHRCGGWMHISHDKPAGNALGGMSDVLIAEESRRDVMRLIDNH